MLVLARKKNETIVVGDRIEITVLKIKGNTVRLGINAPSDVRVLRGELSPFEIELHTKTPDHEWAADNEPLKRVARAS